MSAKVQQVLPPDAGSRLPHSVRQNLRALGEACNTAAVALNYAIAVDAQAMHYRESQHSASASPPVLAVAGDLEQAAEQFYAHTLAALARAATTYACYAARVASAVTAGDLVAQHPVEPVKPSILVAAWRSYLPRICFDPTLDPRRADQQNRAVEQAYAALGDVITQQLHGENVGVYDGPTTTGSRGRDAADLSASFPDVLHHYAATLTWALGVLTGERDAGDTGPAGAA